MLLFDALRAGAAAALRSRPRLASLHGQREFSAGKDGKRHGFVGIWNVIQMRLIVGRLRLHGLFFEKGEIQQQETITNVEYKLIKIHEIVFEPRFWEYMELREKVRKNATL